MESTRSWMLGLLLMAGSAAAGTLRYDQTQTGDTNVHLEVKNVEVLALLDDSASLDEYEYDSDELTEKPPKPGANSTWSTYDPVVEAANATNGGAAPEEPVLGSTAAPAPAAAPAADATTPTPDGGGSSTAPAKRARRCGAGFHRDAHGHCRRTRRPNLQMLMHLGRKPAQPAS